MSNEAPTPDPAAVEAVARAICATLGRPDQVWPGYTRIAIAAIRALTVHERGGS